MAELPIPVFHSLDEIHADGAKAALAQAERWNNLLVRFEKIFGCKATHVARAPGRVNLIGEHIDYALFGVLPTAIERDILMALSPSSAPGGQIIAENLDERYSRQEFAAQRVGEEGKWDLGIDTRELRWESYVKAGYYGVLNHHLAHPTSVPQSMNMLVTGSVPAGSGLSSSAAMVVASTLSFLAMNDALGQVTKGELVTLAMENEKRVGVNSGGMDQAASVISTPSAALYITFYPALRSAPVRIPRTSPSAVFVITNSLVVSDKALSAKVNYNLRVVETLVAARVLARALGMKVGEGEKVTMREVVGRWAGEGEGKDMGPEKLEEVLQRLIPEAERILGEGNGKTGLTHEEMVAASGLDEDAFHQLYLSWVQVEATDFRLYARTKHVLSEALRVLQFRKICASHPSNVTATSVSEQEHGDEVLKELGELMDASQESCSKLFQCSCPELDELTQLAREAGAYGSRLTGAGWGGCAVSLVAEPHVPAFIEQISKTYAPYRALSKEQLEAVVFATKPSSGAGVYVVE
ncbi:Galactokinase [Dacryopinax primogenitus]|uniref:Galactokinase n=1 Tax=Dacryopinax primogenitus (strain DJM 731) TaxID=1858805 RepID=M5G9I0_DACPD|nr:Galactokinase [Dacryopinax primogenitus]EJU04910.1 Galactokinase [Dacryopinax primogenitus]